MMGKNTSRYSERGVLSLTDTEVGVLGLLHVHAHVCRNILPAERGATHIDMLNTHRCAVNTQIHTAEYAN